jgi:hypothetical protein
MSSKNPKAWRAMLRVKYALEHHGSPLKPIFETLLYALAGSGFSHSWGSRRGGANSNYILLGDGRKFYLYGVLRPDPGIEVRKRVRGPVLVKLENEREVLRWVASL